MEYKKIQRKNILLKFGGSLFLLFFYFSQLSISKAVEEPGVSPLTQTSSKYYDFNNNKIEDFTNSQLKNTSHMTYAYMADENFPFTQEFFEQTQKMIERELILRSKCSIAEGTNIVQLCIYGVYENNKWKSMEIFSSPCRGLFYLSGNKPVVLTSSSKPHDTPVINIQKIGYQDEKEKGFLEIRQRQQPSLKSIKFTLKFLASIETYIKKPTENKIQLKEQALNKQEEIKELKNQKNKVIEELTKDVLPFQNLITSSSTTTTSENSSITSNITHKFMVDVLQELITCLKSNDFNFHVMTEAKKNKNFNLFLTGIQKKLSKRSLEEIFNSKSFNLGCSEPLLLLDTLFDELSNQKIIQLIKKELVKENLNEIVIQLHSTKTPCMSCLIGCCGHLHTEEGIIKKFLKKIETETSKKKSTIKLYFLISYHHSYKDNYDFYLPLESTLNNSSIGLVNMELYWKKMKTVKEVILKEKMKNGLLEKIKINNGILKNQDIESFFKEN